MLSPVAALPLLLAATLDASPSAPARPSVPPYAAAPKRQMEQPLVPSIESSLRAPEPALRRVWSAVGCGVTQAVAPALLRAMAVPWGPSAIAEVDARRLRTRGPPVVFRGRFPISSLVAGRG